MLLIKKFGGTSVGSIDRIKNVASIVANYFNKGDKIIVVISAMSNVTNDIYGKLSDISLKTRNLREFDQAMATGEQISASLLSIALGELGLKSKSYNAFNLPIYGDGEYGDGYITYVNSSQLKNDLDNDIIPVITGFQGWKKQDNSFITLGRGGSDYSAVMVAAAMHADMCCIYTDVEGVYSADPRIEKNAVKIDDLSYDEIIEIAKDGAKVLQAKSVIAAKKYNINLKVVSSFEDNSGTFIANKVMINRDRNLKVISCNDNLFYYKFDNELKDIAQVDFIGEISNKKFALLHKKDRYLFNDDDNIIDDVVKITIMSLNEKEILNLIEIEDLLKNNEIDYIYVGSVDKKVILIINEQYKKIAVNLLHHKLNS